MRKSLALTISVLLGSASMGSAETYFTLSHVQDGDSIVEFGRINSDADGFVHIYRLHAGQMGALIGSEALHAGTNSDVRVQLTSAPQQDAMAVVVLGDQVVASQRVRFNG